MIRKIKVFLVEDEVIIRSGVKKSINWEQEGYEFVGEASDGELAYPMILKEKPYFDYGYSYALYGWFRVEPSGKKGTSGY